MLNKCNQNTLADRVSIIIPVYNVEAYVEICVKSVLEQSYDNIEVLIINDQGTDKSIEICQSIISNYRGDKIIRIIHHHKNLGLSEARNTGIKEATGKWLYFVDSDDALEDNAISNLISLGVRYPQVNLIIGKIKCPQNPESYKFPFCLSTNYIEGNGIGEYLLFTDKIPVNAWDKLILREFVLEHNLFFRPNLIHEDELWMYMVSTVLDKIAFSHSYTYIHNTGVNPKSIMNTLSLERTRKNWEIILAEVLNHPAKFHMDRANLKYLGHLLSYYKLVPDNSTSNDIFQHFLCNLSSSNNNKKLVQLLKVYNKMPFPFIRSQLLKLIRYKIIALQYPR